MAITWDQTVIKLHLFYLKGYAYLHLWKARTLQHSNQVTCLSSGLVFIIQSDSGWHLMMLFASIIRVMGKKSKKTPQLQASYISKEKPEKKYIGK